MRKIVFIALVATIFVGCSNKYTYEVVHHKNVRDTIVARRYTFNWVDRVVIADESGSFTEVEWIKRIK